jgi:hypothetical protein
VTDDCAHELPARSAGLPPDWRERLTAARLATQGPPPTTLADRRARARGWLELIELETGVALLELRPAPEAERALQSLARLVAGDADPELRASLGLSLLAIGRARRIAAPRGRAKVDAEVEAIEAALVLAEQAPVIDTLVATCLAALVKTGLFQLEDDLRERAFAAGRELHERLGATTQPAVAAEVARGLDTWASMLPRTDPQRAQLLEARDRLLGVARAG